MIKLILTGGLGNQLFQYATARHLAMIHDTTVCIDIVEYLAKPSAFQLGQFNLDFRILNPALAVLHKVAFRENLWVRRNRTVFYYEDHHDYEPQVLSLPDDSSLMGYFQSEKYFSPIADVVRRELTPKKSAVRGMDQETFARVEGSNSVSLHIRRGDYLNNPRYAVCTMEYYKNAMEYLRDVTECPLFVIFSDDIRWCRENIQGPDVVYSDNKETRTAQLTDLVLMGKCRHNIIANSSYSWWGAWLNANPQKIVVTPDRWFSDGSAAIDDKIPEGWVKVKTR